MKSEEKKDKASVRIVLIDTSHPGNIGAAARAMKNMGLTELMLVRPRGFPSEEATARAAGAADVLVNARVVETLDEAVIGCGLVLGTTSRARMHHFHVFDVRAAAEKIVKESATGSAQDGALDAPGVAVLFGSERFGLTNEELLRCNWLIRIPTGSDYASLNVAMAAQIICYELLMARGTSVEQPEREVPLASAEELQRLYVHLEEVMDEVQFVDRTPSGEQLMGRFRRLFNRAELDRNEVNILRGLLTAVQRKRRPAGSGHQ